MLALPLLFRCPVQSLDDVKKTMGLWTCIDDKCSQILLTQHMLALRPCPVQSLDDMKKTMGLWMNTSIAIFKDQEASAVSWGERGGICWELRG